MKNLNLKTLFSTILLGAVTFLLITWFTKKEAKMTKETAINMEKFQEQLADLEKQFLEQLDKESHNTFTVHVYDLEGNLVVSKTFNDELIMNYDLLLPESYEYITTIHGDPYFVYNL